MRRLRTSMVRRPPVAPARPQVGAAPGAQVVASLLLRQANLQERLLQSGVGLLAECANDLVYRGLLSDALGALSFLDKVKAHRAAGTYAAQIGDAVRAQRHFDVAETFETLARKYKVASTISGLPLASPDKAAGSRFPATASELQAKATNGRNRSFAFRYGEFGNEAVLMVVAPADWDGRNAPGGALIAPRGAWQLVQPLPNGLMGKQMLQALQQKTGLVGFFLGTWKQDADGNAIRQVDLSANPMTLLQALLAFPAK